MKNRDSFKRDDKKKGVHISKFKSIGLFFFSSPIPDSRLPIPDSRFQFPVLASN